VCFQADARFDYRHCWRLFAVLCTPPVQVVAPKRAALAEANRKLDTANKKLAGIRAKVKELQDKVAALEASFVKATEDKNAAIAQVSPIQSAQSGFCRAGSCLTSVLLQGCREMRLAVAERLCLLRTLQAEKTTRKAELADRLVNGLSGENKRWNGTIKTMDAACGKLVSTCLTLARLGWR
jgi:dynein heavy chain